MMFFICSFWYFESVICSFAFLMCLLSLEFMFISLFYGLYIFFLFFMIFFCVIFLVMGVCEGVLGLSLLVFLVRSVGSDYYSSLNLC